MPDSPNHDPTSDDEREAVEKAATSTQPITSSPPHPSASPADSLTSSQVMDANAEFIGLKRKTAATLDELRSSGSVATRQTTLDSMFSTSRAVKKPKVTTALVPSSPASAIQKSTNSTTTSSPQRLSSIPFNRVKWFESLPSETASLLSLELHPTHGLGHTYLKVLHQELTNPTFLSLKRFLAGEGVEGDGSEVTSNGKCFPPMQDIYTWSRKTPLDKVKVVIIGQDPYHGPNQAHGLCFSVRPGVAVPASLRNIYTEIANEYGEDFKKPTHGSLLSWAANGVLLLNTSLTVRPSDAGSHANKGWEPFTDAVVKAVDRYAGGSGGQGSGVVFLCWGAWAAKRVAGLSKTKHLILTSSHPSPLSAHRGFLGNGHFKSANAWLEKRYGEEAKIDWCTLLPNGPPSTAM